MVDILMVEDRKACPGLACIVERRSTTLKQSPAMAFTGLNSIKEKQNDYSQAATELTYNMITIQS